MAMRANVTAGIVENAPSIWQLLGLRPHQGAMADVRQPSEKLNPTAARRFVMATPVLYRTAGEAGWELGITVNISESGLLLEASRPIPVDSLVTLTFDLPEAMGRLKAGAGGVSGSGCEARRPNAGDPLSPRRPVPRHQSVSEQRHLGPGQARGVMIPSRRRDIIAP